MARKKDSKALFEVLSKTETTMSVPDWMKAKPAGDATTAGPGEAEGDSLPPLDSANEAPPTQDEIPPEVEEGATTAPEEDEIDDEVEVSPEEDETTEEEPDTEEEAAEVDEDEEDEFEDEEDVEEEDVEETTPPLAPEPKSKRRFDVFSRSETPAGARFSLNPRMIVFLVVAAGVLLLLAFVLGRLTAGRSGSTPLQAGAPTNSKELRSLVDTDTPVTCTSGRRDPDRYFLIIETLRSNGDADKAEAERMIKFCKAQGLPADMVELQTGDQPRVAIWCLIGFRFANSEQALEHARKVEDVGLAYFKKYKTYKFLQRRRKDGSLRPFFVSGKVEQAGG